MPKPNSGSNNKRAKEQKRAAKKKAAAKAAKADPWVGVPLDDAQLTCVASGDLVDEGQCNILVLRPLPGGRFAVASFLLDGGVVGLKDAWGYPDSSLSEFNEMLAEARADGLPLERIAPDAARALIAGGIRYAQEYGFRPADDWPRWAGVLGGIGDWRAADTRPFRPEYAETIAYARTHLVGQSPDDFFDRPDITFVFPPGETPPPRPTLAVPSVLSDPTLQPTPADAWVEPTREQYAAAFMLLDKRRASIVADATRDLAALGVTPGDHFAEDAVAVRAAAMCVLTCGRPPADRVTALALPAGLDGDLGYFCARLLDVLFARKLDGEAMDVLRAGSTAAPPASVRDA